MVEGEMVDEIQEDEKTVTEQVPVEVVKAPVNKAPKKKGKGKPPLTDSRRVGRPPRPVETPPPPKPVLHAVPGQKLPKGLHNPEAGQAGHRCLDPHGLYKPNWVSMFIMEGPAVPGRLPFINPGSRPQRYWAKTGEWVDVPKWVAICARGCQYDYQIEDASATALTHDEVPRVSVSRPRFAVQTEKSA